MPPPPVAAGGVRTHLVKYIENAQDGSAAPSSPSRSRPSRSSPTTSRRSVGRWSANREGTGAAFAGAPYQAAGKTGTAQVFSLKGGKYNADRRAVCATTLFIAFAPADKPTIALAVLVENGGFGAESAAPIARQVLDYYLLGKLPAGIAPNIRRRGTTGDSAGD
jgi:penicillin-binding protein 2